MSACLNIVILWDVNCGTGKMANLEAVRAMEVVLQEVVPLSVFDWLSNLTMPSGEALLISMKFG